MTLISSEYKFSSLFCTYLCTSTDVTMKRLIRTHTPVITLSELLLIVGLIILTTFSSWSQTVQKDTFHSSIYADTIGLDKETVFLLPIQNKSKNDDPNESFIITCKHRKKGIYKNYWEFLRNDPSITTDFLTIKIDQPFNTGDIEKINYIKIYDIEKNKYKRLKEDVFGFCDGKNIYYQYYNNFYQIEEFGKYCIFHETQQHSPVYIEDIYYVLDLTSSYTFVLNVANVLKLISSDLNLRYEYETDNKKRKHLKKYIIEYNQRNPITSEDLNLK
jgi:hypothetical protein